MNGESLEVTQLVGPARIGESGSSASWSQVRVVTPISAEDREQTGSLLMVIHLANGSEKGEELVEEVVNRFQTEGGFPRFEWVKRTRDFLEEKLKGVGSVVIAVVWTNSEMKKAVYLTGVGEGVEARLERSGGESKIWPMGGRWLSGWLKEGDTLVLATQRFWGEMWGQGSLIEKVGTAREKIAFDETGESAAVIAKVGSDLDETEVVTAWPTARKSISELKPVENMKRTWLFRIGGVFLILLSISVGVGMWRRDKLAKQNQYEIVAQPIRDQLTEAEQIRGVNAVRARDLMTKARQMIEANKNFETGEFSADWLSLSQKVDQEWQVVSGEKQVETKDWFDLGVIKEGMRADRMVADGEWLEILDKDDRLLATVNLKDKSSQQLMAGSSLSGVVDISGGVVLVDAGLVRLAPAKKTTTNIYNQTEELSGVTHLGSFGSNVYTVDATDLWKFPGTDSGLGSRRRYFGVGVTPDMTTVADMWVDGDIWLITADGGLTRYSKGAKVPYSLNGWSDGWGGVVRVETSETELFIWDKTNGVVVVFDKESGEFKRKLINDSLKTATDLVVDEEGQRLIVGVGGKLMEMNYN